MKARANNRADQYPLGHHCEWDDRPTALATINQIGKYQGWGMHRREGSAGEQLNPSQELDEAQKPSDQSDSTAN